MRGLRKAHSSLLFALGFLAAGGLSAGVVAATTTGTTTSTDTTATTTTGTTTTPPPPPPAVIADGVTVGGVDVGGLEPAAAVDEVRRAFSRPLVLVAGKRRFRPIPGRLGAVAYIRTAVARARQAAPGTEVPLKVAVRGKKTRAFVAYMARKVDRDAKDARLRLRNLRPWLTKDRPGQQLDQPRAVRAVIRALTAGRRAPIRLKLVRSTAEVTRASFGPIIVIRRESKRLYLYTGTRFQRVFGVATGQAAYPTPLGRFSIAVMWQNPWWYPPDSDWAAGLEPVPPGPGNPLGTRWMGLTAPGVGIHGTP